MSIHRCVHIGCPAQCCSLCCSLLLRFLFVDQFVLERTTTSWSPRASSPRNQPGEKIKWLSPPLHSPWQEPSGQSRPQSGEHSPFDGVGVTAVPRQPRASPQLCSDWFMERHNFVAPATAQCGLGLRRAAAFCAGGTGQTTAPAALVSPARLAPGVVGARPFLAAELLGRAPDAVATGISPGPLCRRPVKRRPRATRGRSYSDS